ncbi:diguanylate cyclase [Bacillus sp. B15-48]|uniref:sensor domain-containing diguanylate cyclase n=1 Tax=Bacillus sp. B15-48 TaxID=1548601 RepID=UPI00193ECF7C|nr:diguanylate cyclase [Bacillus sp. B15-48]MBM4764986.1 diguanylate cyclase [Bacillus sp. B15-48]
MDKNRFITIGLTLAGIIGGSQIGRATRSVKKDHSMIEAISDPYFLLDRKWKFVYINNEAAKHLQKAKKEIIGKKLWEIYPQSIGLYLHEQYLQAIDSGKETKFETYFDTIERWYSVKVNPSREGLSILFIDITEHKNTNEELKRKEEFYRFIAENSSDIIMRLNKKGALSFISPACYSVLGYRDEEMMSQDFIDLVHPDDQEYFRTSILTSDVDWELMTFIYRMRKQDGTYIWMEATARRILDELEKLDEILTVSRDITKRKNKEQELQLQNEQLLKLSNTDALTEVGNRRALELTFNEEWKRALRSKTPISVILLDIDHFKIFNDSYGHQNGDQCLYTIAKTIKETLKRSTDFVARYGGEEFIILLPSTNIKGARSVAESIRKNIQKLKIPHEYSPTKKLVTVSIGIASIHPRKNDNPKSLIFRADNALYKAKSNGRNKIAVNKAKKHRDGSGVPPQAKSGLE